MATFNDILKDTATFPDAMEIDFGGSKVPLGSLRQFTAGELSAIAKRQQEVERNYSEATASRASALELSTKAQELYASLQAASKNVTVTNPADDPWETDPIYAPVRSRLAKSEATEKELRDTLKKLQATQDQLATIGGWDRWERQWQAVPKDKRPKDKSMEDIVKYAAENKILDRFGIPSVSLAMEKLTEGDRVAEAEARGRAAGAEEAEARLRASTMPRPNYNPAPAQRKGSEVIDDLDNLTERVLEDKELRQMVESLNL